MRAEVDFIGHANYLDQEAVDMLHEKKIASLLARLSLGRCHIWKNANRLV